VAWEAIGSGQLGDKGLPVAALPNVIESSAYAWCRENANVTVSRAWPHKGSHEDGN